MHVAVCVNNDDLDANGLLRQLHSHGQCHVLRLWQCKVQPLPGTHRGQSRTEECFATHLYNSALHVAALSKPCGEVGTAKDAKQ